VLALNKGDGCAVCVVMRAGGRPVLDGPAAVYSGGALHIALWCAQVRACFASSRRLPPLSSPLSLPVAPAQRIASKLRSMETVVDKINAAIKAAPPILPE